MDLPLLTVDSSLIFLVIIGLWAAVLVPHWVRKRSALGGSRVRDRFSTAMRVLSRRDRAEGPHRRGTTSVHPPRPQRAPVEASAHRATSTAPARPAPARASASSTSQRRDRLPVGGLVLLGLLVGLLLAVPVTSVLAATGTLPLWTPGASLGGLILLFAGLRRRALLRREARRRSAGASRARLEDVAPRHANRSAEGRRPVVARTAPVRADAAADATGSSAPAAAERRGATTAARSDVVAERFEQATPAAERADDWTPVPVPPPTYTLKPSAPRRAPRPAAEVAAPEPVPAPPAAERAPGTLPGAGVPAVRTEQSAAASAASSPVPAPAPTWDLEAVLERRRAAAG